MSDKPTSGMCEQCSDYSTYLTIITAKDGERLKVCPLCAEEESQDA